METMNEVNENDDTQCGVCLTAKPVRIPLFACTHSHSFCEKCVKGCLIAERFTCPLCRANLPVLNYLKTTGQIGVHIDDVAITIEYDPPPTENLLPAHDVLSDEDPARITCRLMAQFCCCLCALAIVIIVFLIVKSNAGKTNHNG